MYEEYTDEELMEMAGERPLLGNASDYTDEELMEMAGESLPSRTSRQESSTGGVWDSLSKRAGNIADIWTEPRQEDEIYESPMAPAVNFFTKSPGRVLRTAGQLAGGINDIVGAGIASGMGALYGTIPEPARREFEGTLKDVAESDFGKTVGKGFGTLRDAYGWLKERLPEETANVEAVANIAGVVPMAWLGKKGARAIGDATENVIDAFMPLKTLEQVDEAIDLAIESGFKKAIKPTVVGKSDAGLTEKFYDNAKQGTKELVMRHPESLPTNTEEFSRAIRQTKKDIWEESSGMALEAGEQGATVNLAFLRDDLTSVVTAENIPESAKRSARRVLNEIKSYADEIDPTISEELIAHFNSRTKGFWKDPNWHKADDAVFMERSAGILRGLTDDAVENYQGPGWQELRKKYGSLTAIEKAVTDRANVAARRNVKGFFDIADIYITGEFIGALATMDPVRLAKAAGEKFTKHYIKGLNDADKIVEKMFSRVGGLMNERQALLPPVAGYQPKTGPFVKSSAVDRMIDADAILKADIEAERLAAQYGFPENMIHGRRGRGVSPISEGFSATDTGAIDTALRISEDELQAFRAANELEALGEAGTRIGQLSPYPDLGTAVMRANPDLMPYRGMLPSTEVLSGRAVGGAYTPDALPVPVQYFGEGFTARPSGIYEGLSDVQISRLQLREALRRLRKIKKR